MSLDAVRRGRRSAPRGIEAHPSSRFAAGASDEEFDDDADQAEVEQISDEERLERVSDTVVRALSRRQLSSDETHALLMAQGASDAEAVVLVARYGELGYLDDLAMAEALVERLSERQHKSRQVIFRELVSRKLPVSIIEEALDQLGDDQEFTLALDAAMKRVGQLSSYDDTTTERRLMAFLARRGFNSGLVRDVTQRAMATRKSSKGPRFR
ncbi:regulatory protein RecX [Herbiconiux sp.]|uniref:regulatory protein RecX n=1 Tax=Herbiconiux sp. TaxID=1871186 RepID=UPI0025BA1ADF|nr:regulatory protein RecX [Herbiconiux sp.]